MMASHFGKQPGQAHDKFGAVLNSFDPLQACAEHIQYSRVAAVLQSFMIGTLAIAGLALTGYLSWAAITSGKVAGCGSGELFDCSEVLNSKWSSVFGVPVSVPAFVVYTVVLFLFATANINCRESRREYARFGLTGAAFVLLFSAFWFLSLQLFVVRHFCSYCLAVHVCGLLLSIAVLWRYRIGEIRCVTAATLGLVTVGILAMFQFLSEGPQTFKIEKHNIPASSNGDLQQNRDQLFNAPGFEK